MFTLNYSQLFERAIVGVFQSSVEGRYLCANPAFAKMLGYESPEELIASVTDIGTQVYADPSQRAVVLKCLAERESMVDFEFECRRKNGAPIWVRQDSYAVRDESGTLLYFEGFIHDITERRRADEALRLARYTVDQATVSVFWLRADSTIADVNQTACKTLGYSREELLSNSASKFDPDTSPLTWHLDWNELRRVGTRTFPRRHRRKDGTVMDVEITANLMTFGGQELVCAFVRDITEQKRSAEERDRLWNMSVDPICIAGFDGYFKQVNPAWIKALGWSEAELLSFPWLHFVHPDDHAGTNEAAVRLLRGEPLILFENRYRDKNGGYHWFSWTGIAFQESQVILAAVRDITEQKRLSGDLEKLLALSPDLICSVRQNGFCHQVNKAFTTTLGWTEEELRSRRMSEIVHPDDREQSRQSLAMLFGGAPVAEYEVRVLCKNGTYRWVQWRVSTVIDHGLLFAIGRDITDRRREVQLLRDVEGAANVGGWDLNFATGELSWTRQTFLIHDLAPHSPQPTLAEAIGYYAPEAQEAISLAVQRGMVDGSDWYLELPLITATERRIWVVAKGQVEFAEGKPSRAFGSFQDITDRKQADVKLRETKASLRAFLNALQEPAFLMDTNGTVLVSNESLAHRVGTTVEDLAGKRIFDFLPTPVANLRMSMLERVKQTRQAVQFEDSNRGRYFINYASPVVDSAGEVSRVAVLAVDITDRIKAEEGLRLFRALVDQTTDGIEVVDPETGRFLDVNERACTAHGYTRDEYLALSVPDIDPLMRPETIKDVIQAKREANQLTFESQHRRKDGTIFPVEVKLNFVQIDREYVVAGVRDITERKHLEEQLRQSQKLEAIGRLAGGVAHDFNNLLTIIIGHAEILLAEPATTQHRRDSALEILAAGERAAKLTAQLLAFSRKAIIEPKVLDLNHLVKSAVTMLSRLIGENVRIVKALDPAIAKVKIDPGQMEQLLINLAVNARDAMPNGGVLTFATTNVTVTTESSPDLEECPPGNYVRLTIIDTGNGMTPEVQQQIFEPFFTTKEVGKGTGLGLATVYGIVAQAKGAITVESEVGNGTTFRIVLPAIAGPAESESKFIRVAPPGTETILLVEDDHHVRQLALLTLKTYGYTVLSAGSSEAARELAASHTGTIHLLLSDVVMPDFGGRELAEKVKVIHPTIAVLFISGYFDDAVIRHGIEAATDAFLQKPFTPQSLARKVRDVLDATRT
jgi:two-component system cell cycle sensor histidine kinase/response regulator CckA